MPIEQLSEELREHEALKDFSDPDALAKSFIETQKKIGAMVTLPGDDAPTEAKQKFFNRLGRPEKAEEYEIKAEGLGMDEGNEKALREALHSLNVTQSQAKGLVNWLEANTKERLDKIKAGDAEASEKVANDLKIEWGAAFEKNSGAKERAIKEFFGESAETISALAATDINIAKALATIGASVSEDGSGDDRENAAGTGNIDAAEARKQISEHQKDPKGPYRDRSHPEHADAVEAVRALYEVAYPTSNRNADE